MHLVVVEKIERPPKYFHIDARRATASEVRAEMRRIIERDGGNPSDPHEQYAIELLQEQALWNLGIPIAFKFSNVPGQLHGKTPSMLLYELPTEPVPEALAAQLNGQTLRMGLIVTLFGRPFLVMDTHNALGNVGEVIRDAAPEALVLVDPCWINLSA